MQIRPRLASTAIVLIAALIQSCGAGSVSPEKPDNTDPQLLKVLEAQLYAELQRLGIDPQRAASAAPSGSENGCFDMSASLADADGTGPAPPTGAYFTWTERCVGDYDQNGQVGISDLTPLGQHFHETVQYDEAVQHGGVPWWPTGNPNDAGGSGPGVPATEDSPAYNWRRARIDGDSNGELNISDITPIAQHWAQRIDGFTVWRRRPGEAEFTPLPHPSLSVAYSASRPTIDATRPVRYQYIDDDLGPDPSGIYEYYVSAYDASSAEHGTASSPLVLLDMDSGGGGITPPVVVIRSDLSSGPAPLPVSFDASGSYDIDGNIVKYEWDTDGNLSSWEIDTGLTPTLSWVLHEVGPYTQWVRVTDNDGFTSIGKAVVDVLDSGDNESPHAVISPDVSEGSLPLTVEFDASASSDNDGTIVRYEWDPAGELEWAIDTGSEPVLQYTYILPGNYIARLRVTDNDGAVAVATTEIVVHPSGAFWRFADPDGTSAVTSRSASLAVINGFPAIAYHEDFEEKIVYMRALDIQGEAWGAVLDIAPTGGWGGHPNLTEVSGRPAISYVNGVAESTGNLRFIRASDENGDSWPGSGVLVYDGAGEAEPAHVFEHSMTTNGGAPAIAFPDIDNNKLKYVLASSDSGGSWPAAVDVYEGTNVGRGAVLLMVSGRPAICHRDHGNGAVIYQRAANSSGTDWHSAQSIELVLASNGSADSSMALVGGNPAVCRKYLFGGVIKLEFSRALDPLGSAWGAWQTLDTAAFLAEEDYGSDCVLAGGTDTLRPFVVFHNSSNLELRAVFAANTAGSSWGPSELIQETTYSASSARYINGLPACAFAVVNGAYFAIKR